jgi:hypothetical protein
VSAAVAAELAFGFAFIGLAFEVTEALLYGFINRFLNDYGFIVTKAKLGLIGYEIAFSFAILSLIAVFAAFVAFISFFRGVCCSIVGNGIGNFHWQLGDVFNLCFSGLAVG